MVLLRSYVLRARDPHIEAVLAPLRPVSADESAVEQELRRIVLPYVRWEPQAVIREGDMAACRLESEIPRFRKENVKYIVGSGMFRKDIEQAADGMKTGEIRTVSLPEGTVRMTVLEVLRRIVPEPSDEMVPPLGMEGVSRIQEFIACQAGVLLNNPPFKASFG